MIQVRKYKKKNKFTITIIWKSGSDFKYFSEFATDFISDSGDDFVTVVVGRGEYKFYKDTIVNILITSY